MTTNIEPYDLQLLYIRLALKLKTDLAKHAEEELQRELHLLCEANLAHYQTIVKQVKLLTESLTMLYERIQTELIRKQVFALPTLAQQKELVDKLYAEHESANKVKQAYLANFNLEPAKFHWNVSFLDGRHYFRKLDLLVGGSPCQSFSLEGKQRGLDDTRGTLFYEFARLVQQAQPKVFIYENVRAILSNDKGATWQTITAIFEQLGYDWQYQIMNAKDYGIPQSRERVIVVGFRKDLQVKGFKFPQPCVLEKRLVDFLEQEVAGKYYLSAKGVDCVNSPLRLEKRYTQISGEIALCQMKNQQFNWQGDFIFVEDNPHLVPAEDRELYDAASLVLQYRSFGQKPRYQRVTRENLWQFKLSNVETQEIRVGRLRKLTPRECLRLMGFADDFKIVVSDTATYQQAGNSIVVDVLIHLMREILIAYPDLIGKTSANARVFTYQQQA